jgi:hypothetical protein
MAAAWVEDAGFQTPLETEARVAPRTLAGRSATLEAAASDAAAPSWSKKLRRDKAMGILLRLMK